MAFQTLNANIQAVLVGATVGTLVALATYWLGKQKRKVTLPTLWEPVGKVKSLYIYPLKSGRRMEIKTAQCTEYGFQLKIESASHLRDRCLVVYNESNKEFRTARNHPKLLLIEVTPADQDHFIVTAPAMEKLRIEVPKSSGDIKDDKITMWLKTEVFALDCGNEAARWLSRYILGEDSGLRLAYHDGLHSHRTDIMKTHKEFIDVYPNLENSATGMYTDLTSYLLLNDSSVDDLISKAPNANITMHNFRPNIVVAGKGLTPFAEDNWDWVKIGPVVLRTVKGCTRCALTTIDPETGVKLAKNEPLETLKTYRKLRDLRKIELEGGCPVMGIHMGLARPGDISVGDTVYVGKY